MSQIDKEITEALTRYKKIAVVGLSPDADRPSYGVSKYMQGQGYEITPVRPGGETILGVQSVAVLTELKGPVEIVDVFRKSDAVPQIVDEAIAVGAKVLWLQEGVSHPVAEEKAQKAGLKVFSDLCILKEHARLIRRR
jgi:predicted CoA-binding protein